jgi:hypothetical protein
VAFVLFFVAKTADNTLLDAFGFETDHVEGLTDMIPAFGALGVLESYDSRLVRGLIQYW